MPKDDFLLKLIHDTVNPESLPTALIVQLEQAEMEIAQAYRSQEGWFLQIKAKKSGRLENLVLPEGWRQVEVIPADGLRQAAPLTGIELRLGDPLAFAFLQWPAVIALFELPTEGWWLLLYILIAAWLLLSTLSAYLGCYKDTPQFGNALLLASLSIAAAWWLHTVIWSLIAVGIAMLLLYVAQRALLRSSLTSNS
jgi:hypothetical protein